MRLAFVGYGSIAQAHARAFRQIPGVEIEWVVGRVPESMAQFAREWEIPHTTLSLDEALAADVQGVVITSPSDLHAEQTTAALKAGKHVLVEIPASTNLADSEAVAALAAQTALRVQVAHTQRYYPALQELARAVRAGSLHPHHVICRWFFLRRSNVNWMGRQRSWTDNLLWHHACHVVDAALWLLGGGEGSEVKAQFSRPHPELGIPLDLDLQFRASSSLVSISMSYNSTWPRHDYFLIGEEDSREYRDNRLWGPNGLIAEPPATDDSILNQNLEWLNAIREQREPEVNLPTVLPAMRILQQAQEQLDQSPRN